MQFSDLVDLQPIFRLLISAFVFFGLYFIALFVQKEPFLTGTITSIKNKVLKGNLLYKQKNKSLKRKFLRMKH